MVTSPNPSPILVNKPFHLSPDLFYPIHRAVVLSALQHQSMHRRISLPRATPTHLGPASRKHSHKINGPPTPLLHEPDKVNSQQAYRTSAPPTPAKNH
ncbi:hypothetical protein ES332_D08G190700v1 [Gossypium tomentosum]|uniref:Uncharacterized protein n=1 Tax=Gossypium tomentosum TaxID=34277 RepID=A0A5D2JWT2_GOSTO|nr:hypothetical protein ES332_D08G190700v1 [Gossypium tomentosum]